ncbi:MAG: transporter substrate-binding domain-containing protein [Planctomycetota bacterium]
MPDPNPQFLGLRSYHERHAPFFFGRENETELLYRMVRRETLTTVFAPSGSGKTSLLRAGLFPRLRNTGFLPIRVRLDYTADTVDHERDIRRAIEQEVEQRGLELGSVVEPQAEPHEEHLWEFLHRVEVWDDDANLLTPVIVLDQFEELFTLGHRQPESARLLEALADTVEKRLPNAVRERLRERGQRPGIPIDLQRFKIIIALREDFVTHLDDVSRDMPSVMYNRLPLHEMTGMQAMRVILGAGDGVMDVDVAMQIIRVVSKARGQDNAPQDLESITVEPSLLSLVCRELDQKRVQRGEQTITANNLETASADILQDFYEKSFEGLDPRVRVFVENRLLTSTGFRKSQPIDDATAAGVDAAARRQLIDRNVLRQINRTDISHIELTHDLLTGIVKSSRDSRLAKEETEELRKTKKSQRRRIQLLGVVSLVLLCLLSLSIINVRRAQHAEQAAQANAQQATDSARRAEDLLNFMAVKLHDRLLPVGRLDILEDVADKAASQFGDLSATQGDTLSSPQAIARANALNRFGQVLGRRGDIGQAIRTHRSAIELLPQTDAPSNELRNARLRLLIDYGTLLSRWGNPADALAVADQAEQALPRTGGDRSRHRLALLRGQAHLSLGQSQAALDHFRSVEQPLTQTLLVASAQPQDLGPAAGPTPPTFADRVLLARASQGLAEAYAQLQRLPDSMRQRRTVLATFDDLAAAEPGNDEWTYQKALALIELGKLHLQINDLAGARDKLEPAITLARRNEQRTRTADDQAPVFNTPWLYAGTQALLALARVTLAESPTADIQTISEQAREHVAERYATEADKRLSLTGSRDSPVYRILLSDAHRLRAEIAQARDNQQDAADHFARALDVLQLAGEEGAHHGAVHTARLEACLALAEHRESAFSDSALAPALLAMIEQLDAATAEDRASAADRLRLARAHRLAATAHRERGKSRQVIQSYEAAVSLLTVLTSDDGSAPDHLRRLLAQTQLELGIYQRDTGGSQASNEQARQLLLAAHQGFTGLQATVYGRPTPLWRVEDRLSAAQALAELSPLLDGDASLDALRQASDLGYLEATQRLADRLSPDDGRRPELSSSITRQIRKTVNLPAFLNDQLQDAGGMRVQRSVLTPVVLTAPYRPDGEPAGELSTAGALRDEADRLRHDLNLELDPIVRQEFDRRQRYLDDNPEIGLALADAANEQGLDAEGPVSDGRVDGLLRLESPVIIRYPKRTPTVIGTEATLRWDFNGTDAAARNFKLQISISPEFGDGQVLLDRQVSGTQHRVDLSRVAGRSALNRKLYWRVQQVPGLGTAAPRSLAPPWSLTREFEIYTSLWDRITTTGKIRVGISEFEGDLLELNQGNNSVQGFDGEVLNHVKDELEKRMAEEAQARGIPKSELPHNGELEIVPYDYGWDGMFEAVSRAEVDLAISNITRTKEREQRFAIRFTEPYYETRLALVYKKDQGPIRRVDELSAFQLTANQGLRGAAVARLLLFDEQPQDIPDDASQQVDDRLILNSAPNLDALFGTIINTAEQGGQVAAITDMAYLEQAFALQRAAALESAEDAIEARGYDHNDFEIRPLVRRDYQRLIDLYQQTQQATGTRARDLAAMETDYGGAEWEQYAVATSARDDGVLLDHLNRAIITLRRSEQFAGICEKAKLPVPHRLTGARQALESQARVATVVPRQPVPWSARPGSASLPPVVMGDTVEFRWNPMKAARNADTPRTAPARYMIQVADHPRFIHGSIRHEAVTTREQHSVTAKANDAASIFDGHRGRLYWRAKRLTRIERPAETTVGLAETEPPIDELPEEGWSTPIAFDYYRDAIERIRTTGTLRVAINGFANGYAVYRGADRQLRGYDVEIMERLRNRLQERIGLAANRTLRIDYVPMAFSEIFPSVRDRQVDMAISGITARTEREERFNIRFSEPYARTRQALIALDNGTVKRAADFVGKTFIVFTNTRGHDMARKLTRDIRTSRGNPRAFLLETIVSGEADATVVDYPTAIKILRDYRDAGGTAPFQSFPITEQSLEGAQPIEPISKEFLIDPYGIPMPADQADLIRLVNETVREIQSDQAAPLREVFERHVRFNQSTIRSPIYPFDFGGAGSLE